MDIDIYIYIYDISSKTKSATSKLKVKFINDLLSSIANAQTFSIQQWSVCFQLFVVVTKIVKFKTFHFQNIDPKPILSY